MGLVLQVVSSTWPCHPQCTRRFACGVSLLLMHGMLSLLNCLCLQHRVAVSHTCMHQHCREGQAEAEVARRFAGA